MNPFPSPDDRTCDINIQTFYYRLTARLCLIFVAITQIISRIIIIFCEPRISDHTKLWYAISMPLLVAMSVIVGLEFFLFKKIGPQIVKYSKRVEFVLMILFTAEWLMSLFSGLSRVILTPSPAFSVSSVYGFINFGYRCLMMLILVQYWQLKIIPPLLASGVVMGYVIYYIPYNTVSILIRGILQMLYIVILYYIEDRMKWGMIVVNMHQEKWMQINDFILNNIPENIMILDLQGQTKFISDYCKSFLRKCHLSLDTQELFQKIKDLSEQPPTEPTSPTFSNEPGEIERQNTVNILIEPQDEPINPNIQGLDDLINHVKKTIKAGLLRERQFLIYNGKLKVENYQDKAIELKLSYIKQFEKEFMILIIRDTTQRDLLVTLSDNNKYKDQLLASVSHELRAPLNGNINLVDSAINSPKVPENIKETLLIPALRSSKFLLHLINDILDMSQIKEKKLRLTFQTGDLKETLKSTAQLVELQAKKKEIQLQLDLDPNLPPKFCTDHLRLSQIVLNLLNNAIKFTQNGAVRLIAAPYNNNTSWVKISVQDSGIGMSQDNVQKLFGSYTHIEFEGRQIMNPSGVGLGLKIASNLSDLLAPKTQQGISVESLPGQGSTFTFIIENKEISPLDLDDELPDLERSQDVAHNIADEAPGNIQPMPFAKLQTCFTTSSFAPNEPEVASKATPESCSCPRILIVDDNPFNTMAFETILSTLEINCDSAYSGFAAIKKVLNCESKKCGKDCKLYSIIFMDQEMPEMSGSETVREIRRLQKEKLVPQNMRIIGCTAHKSKDEIDRFMESGLDKCIQKPISATIIKDIL